MHPVKKLTKLVTTIGPFKKLTNLVTPICPFVIPTQKGHAAGTLQKEQ